MTNKEKENRQQNVKQKIYWQWDKQRFREKDGQTGKRKKVLNLTQKISLTNQDDYKNSSAKLKNL